MKFVWCCLFVALLTESQAGVNVESVVKHVQSILKANKQLPELTREDIMQLLNDIKAEDAKSNEERDANKDEISNETSEIYKDEESNESTDDNSDTEINTQINNTNNTAEDEVNLQEANIQDNVIDDDKEDSQETTTKSNEPTLMVVLPYTPRDGSSLQELYTRPPRVEVVYISSTTPRPTTSNSNVKFQDNLKDETKLPAQLIDNFPAELQAFLDAHGLKGKPGQDHFLLPLDGFKPLPPAKVIDGSVQLPENLLLTYDLVSPDTDSKKKKVNDESYSLSPNNFLYEPLQPEFPFELDTSSSETKEINLPYDMPVRQTKSIPALNYDPINYDSVKVIPLKKDINPINEEVNGSNEQSKRQTTNEKKTEESETTTTATTTTTEEPKTNSVNDSASSDTDTGASIADLEDSFGGAAPAMPGDSDLPPPRKNGFYWMLDWNSFLEVGDGDTKVNIRLEPKLGDPQMFLPITVP